MKKFLRLERNIFPLLLILVFAVGLIGCMMSRQSILAIPTRLTMDGEYSLDGSDFQPLRSNSILAGRELIVRGHLRSIADDISPTISENSSVRLYLDHISAELFVNGESVLQTSGDSSFSSSPLQNRCGRLWISWPSTGITANDTVELRLTNPHAYGNSYAFRSFLNNMYIDAGLPFRNYLAHRCAPQSALGILSAAAALLLIGAAAAFRRQRKPLSRLLFYWGCLSLSTGLLFFLSTPNFALQYNSTTLGNYARPLCIMLMICTFAFCISDGMEQTCRILSRRTADGCALVAVVLLMLTAVGIIGIFNAFMLFLPVGALAFALLLICCIRSFSQRRTWYTLVITALILSEVELINLCTGWFRPGSSLPFLFVVLLIAFLAGRLNAVIADQIQAARAQELTRELQNSRAILAMSQIRIHFIFNVLNAISGMCKYDPVKADETVVRFARYLRSNIEIMQNDTVQPFYTELEHVKNYMELQIVRYGDKLRFQTDITCSDFRIPPLTLQPLVENAIKHGLLPKGVGTVTIATRREDGCAIVMVQDDGVGMDPTAPLAETSIGLQNVRLRLENMVHGTMEITSAPGEGTTVTIRIPKED